MLTIKTLRGFLLPTIEHTQGRIGLSSEILGIIIINIYFIVKQIKSEYNKIRGDLGSVPHF